MCDEKRRMVISVCCHLKVNLPQQAKINCAFIFHSAYKAMGLSPFAFALCNGTHVPLLLGQRAYMKTLQR